MLFLVATLCLASCVAAMLARNLVVATPRADAGNLEAPVQDTDYIFDVVLPELWRQLLGLFLHDFFLLKFSHSPVCVLVASIFCTAGS